MSEQAISSLPPEPSVPALDLARAKLILETALLTAQEPLPLAELKRLFDDELGAEPLRRLLEELRERVISQSWAPVRVLASRLGPDAAVRGAAGAVVREVLSNPTAVRAAATGPVVP